MKQKTHPGATKARRGTKFLSKAAILAALQLSVNA
jgi:hypothetical protein